MTTVETSHGKNTKRGTAKLVVLPTGQWLYSNYSLRKFQKLLTELDLLTDRQGKRRTLTHVAIVTPHGSYRGGKWIFTAWQF